MIIYIDGSSHAKIDAFVDMVAGAFSDPYHEIIRGCDMETGERIRYLHKFVEYLDSPRILIMKHGWVYDHYRATNEMDGESRYRDWFANEWLHSRPLLGRGGRFIVVPKITQGTIDRVGLDPSFESARFIRYAQRCSYELVELSEEMGLWFPFITRARRAALVGIHRVSSEKYVGPHNPHVTFVGAWTRHFSFTPRPFVDRVSLEYFRSLGVRALYDFGYAPTSALEELPVSLRRRVVTVGNEAHYYYPQYPNVPDVMGDPTAARLHQFHNLASVALEFYKENNHDSRLRRSREGGKVNPHPLPRVSAESAWD